MRRLRPRAMALALTAGCLVAATDTTNAQEPKAGAPARPQAGAADDQTLLRDDPSVRPTNRLQQAEGVIVKVEPVRDDRDAEARADEPAVGGRTDRGHVRVTINTSVVWRDWVRDQAVLGTKPEAVAQTKEGADSVATQGHPRSADSLVTVEVDPRTKLEGRFRSTVDERSRGALSPEGAATEPKGEAAGERKAARPADRPEPQRLQASDLKPGQFVMIQYRHTSPEDPATEILVLKPVGGPDTDPGAIRPGADTEKSSDRAKSNDRP